MPVYRTSSKLEAKAENDNRSPFGFHLLRYVRSVEDPKKLNFAPNPVMIIAASGMCEGGRILHHLKNNISDPSTTILFVGYQAQNTLGRKILEGLGPVRIFGEMYLASFSLCDSTPLREIFSYPVSKGLAPKA